MTSTGDESALFMRDGPNLMALDAQGLGLKWTVPTPHGPVYALAGGGAAVHAASTGMLTVCKVNTISVGHYHTHGPSDQPFPSGTQVGTALPTDLHTADLHPAVTFFAMTKPLRATDTGAKCPTTVGCVVTNPSRPARSIYRYQGSTSIPGNSINNLWLKLPAALGDPYSNGGWVLFPRQ